MFMINLYESILSLQCLNSNGQPVGIRVLDSQDTMYDISKDLIEEVSEEGIIQKMSKVLDNSVFPQRKLQRNSSGVYVTTDEIHGLPIVPERRVVPDTLKALLSKVSVIADFKSGNGDTNVVSIGSDAKEDLTNVKYKFQPYRGWFKDDFGVKMYILDEDNFVLNHSLEADSNARYLGIGNYFYGTCDGDLSFDDLQEGTRVGDFSVVFKGNEYGSRTAEIFRSGRPIVEYMKLLERNSDDNLVIVPKNHTLIQPFNLINKGKRGNN